MHTKFLIKCQNLTSQKKEEIINFFTNHPNSNWVGSCKGSYDIIVGFVTKNLLELKQIKEEIFNKYSTHILKNNISIMLEAEIYGRKYFLDSRPQVIKYVGTQQPIKLENTDFKILDLLSKNSKMKVTDIATKLKITPRIATYKIKQLEKNKIIQKFTISINHSLLGLSFFKLFISMTDSIDKKKILSYFANQKNCFGNVETLAEWDFEPEFEVYSTDDLYKIIDEINLRFGEKIKTIDTIMIDKEYKFKPLPKIN